MIEIESRDKYLKYYYRNKGKIALKRKKNYLLKKEKYKEINKKNYDKNRDKILACKKRSREKHKDAYNAKARLKRKMATEKPSDYLKRKFGITKADYDVLFKKQKGVCAICKKPEEKKRLAVDHCHKTGKIRALLCSRCNTSIGRFNDDYRLIQKAVNYLKKHS